MVDDFTDQASNNYAPVALFSYRRPKKLQECVAALALCPEASRTSVTIFVDGPKNYEEQSLVAETVKVAKSASGFRAVEVVERQENMGLSGSVISGVTFLLDRSSRIIVLEDDLVVSGGFLSYMNTGLDLYEKNAAVISIHGYCYPVPEELPETFFLRGADCWGWATWKEEWALFEPDASKLLHAIEASEDQALFDFNGAYGYTQMLRDQVVGRVDSWAIRWYASAFLANKLTLYPGKSLVINTGLDGSGTHAANSQNSHGPISPKVFIQENQPLEDSAEARSAFVRYFEGPNSRGSLGRRLLRPIGNLFRRGRS